LVTRHAECAVDLRQRPLAGRQAPERLVRPERTPQLVKRVALPAGIGPEIGEGEAECERPARPPVARLLHDLLKREERLVPKLLVRESHSGTDIEHSLRAEAPGRGRCYSRLQANGEMTGPESGPDTLSPSISSFHRRPMEGWHKITPLCHFSH